MQICVLKTNFKTQTNKKLKSALLSYSYFDILLNYPDKHKEQTTLKIQKEADLLI